MRVKNLHDKGGRPVPAGYDSWLDWWMKQKGVEETPKCANLKCLNKAILGGHVKNDTSEDNAWYMVPLCHGCNQLVGPFDVNASDMVPLNK